MIAYMFRRANALNWQKKPQKITKNALDITNEPAKQMALI
jgi:hypothetical protein